MIYLCESVKYFVYAPPDIVYNNYIRRVLSWEEEDQKKKEVKFQN